MKIKLGDKLKIKFANQRQLFPKSGSYRVERLCGPTSFMIVGENGGNIILDVKEHGKSYLVQSINNLEILKTRKAVA